VLKFNAAAHQDYKLRLNLIPEPFVGNPDAPLLLLGNNPGVKDEPRPYKLTPSFVSRMRANLLHQPSQFPFLYFDPNPALGPPDKGQWWERKLKHLLSHSWPGKESVRSILSRTILAVEFLPYASHRYRHGSLRLPSQKYSIALVENAMSRGAVIVLTRGIRRWEKAMPNLAKYDLLVRLKEVQRAPISPDNCCNDGYQKIARTIEAALP
jgi:hypothetical protein